MFEFFNAVFLAATLLSNIVVYSDGDFPFPQERESAVAVSMHREFWRDDGNGKCKYTGIMVPYVRDWEEVVKHGDIETVLPPEPNKTAGQAFIINKKVCGATIEPVFRTGAILSAKGSLLYKHSFAAFDVTEMKVEDRPKWLEQVLLRIERVAAHDKHANEFVRFNMTASFQKMPAGLALRLQSTGQAQAAAAAPH